jgi:RimJ/RimL family protein N-acetyltransferase
LCLTDANIIKQGDVHNDENSPGTVLGTVGVKEPAFYFKLFENLEPENSAELLRMELGYMFLPAHWGKGYAAEAVKAVLESYASSTNWWRRDTGRGFALKEKLWMRAVTGPTNTKSIRVAEKVGLDKMGFHEWEGEDTFVGGAWQPPKVLIFGKMLV